MNYTCEYNTQKVRKSNKNLTKVEEILKRLKRAYNLDDDYELAELLGYSSTGTISNWKSRGSVNLKRIKERCEKINLNYLTNGEGRPFIDDIDGKFNDLKDRIEDEGISYNERDLLLEVLESDVKKHVSGLQEIVDRIHRLRKINRSDD